MLKFSKKKQVGKYKKTVIDKTNAVDKENPLQFQCEQYLYTLGIAFIRIPATVQATVKKSRYNQDKRDMHKYLTGVPDITILFSDGRYLAVELKSKKGVQTEGQRKFENSVGSNNYFIVTNFDAFQKLVDCYRGIKGAANVHDGAHSR